VGGPRNSGMSGFKISIKKLILDFYPKLIHIILHPHPMRDWTRAVVFGWVGSGSCGAAYRRPSLGRSTQKAWFAGWPPASAPMGFLPRSMPSHPSVRHYDRSEPMRLTNPGCRQAVVREGPFEASRPSLCPQPEAERIKAGAKSGSDDRIIRAGGAARRSTQHPTRAKTAPPAPPWGKKASINPARVRVRAGSICAT